MKNYCIKKGLFTWQYVTVFSRTEMMKNALKESISVFLKKNWN